MSTWCYNRNTRTERDSLAEYAALPARAADVAAVEGAAALGLWP